MTVSLVKHTFNAKSAHAAATTDSEKTRLESHIDSLDCQIDQQVYELGVYTADLPAVFLVEGGRLTEEEIRIVEGT